jgi:predicted dehydrogenase
MRIHSTFLKPLPIAIVGLNFGQHIVNQLLEQRNRAHFCIVAVCDLDKEKAMAMADRLKAKVYTELDSLLTNPDIPVIGLFTGPNGRAELVRRIIRAGKDVMTTKPFEMDPEKAAAILREAVRRRRVVHLNSPAPNLSPDLQQITRWREQFDLGRPIAARGEVWASYREKRDGSWYDDPVRCPVAPIFRLGIYLINDLIDLFGPAEEVQVTQSRLFTKRPTPDNAQLGILFKSGALANVYASFCVDDAHPFRNSLTLNFERGTIYRNVGPPSIPEKDWAELTLISKRKSGTPFILRKAIFGLSGVYQWQAFRRAVDQREAPSAAFRRRVVEGVRILATMTRAAQSSSTLKVV